LRVPEGSVTQAGLRQNVAVGIGYIEAWIRGIGCVPLFNLMEDAATAEISRAQLWQWIHHGAFLEDGEPVTAELCDRLIDEEVERTKTTVDAGRYDAYKKASSLMRELIKASKFTDFLTVPAYSGLIAAEIAEI
jgi:malate synthase